MASVLLLALAAVAAVLAASLAAVVYALSIIGFDFDTTIKTIGKGNSWTCSSSGPNRRSGCASLRENHSWATMLSKQVRMLLQHTLHVH